MAVVTSNSTTTDLGKSTLIKLLTRLWDPTEGDILINDINIKEYDWSDLHSKMSVLFQDFRTSLLTFSNPGKFTPLTVSENIATGNISNHNPTAIQAAAKDADSDRFIQKLPKQYETKLRDETAHSRRVRHNPFAFHTRWISKTSSTHDPDTPVDLSGGQWQKLALSRSFMRASEADLLILDEPSSALDPEAEHNLFKYIQLVRRSRTTIYVTHRFYTVRMATKIAFLEEGRLIEFGGHEKLMALEGGKYAKLFQLQSEGFSTLAAGRDTKEEILHA
jgi:ATP-binding cassette, subfamily B, bacterial